MGRSSRCTDQSASYKSPHSTCEMRPLGECYAASAVEEGCNSPTHQSSDGSSSDRKAKGKIPYGEERENPGSRSRRHRENREANEIESPDKRYRLFESVLSELRMATNYTVEVTPVLDGEENGRGRAFGREIIIRTKG
ncbi:hypothetical protein SK128_001897, partial [Halocaridina rubra]